MGKSVYPQKLAATKQCNACLSVIPAGACVCKMCGTRIEGIQCDACLMMCPEDARVCCHCGAAFKREASGLAGIAPTTIVSDSLAALIIEFSIHPQRIKIDCEKILITSYSLFGLVENNEEIPWEKVAGFFHRSGLIWDSIKIETRGQTSAVIGCLSKRNARKLKFFLGQKN